MPLAHQEQEGGLADLVWSSRETLVTMACQGSQVLQASGVKRAGLASLERRELRVTPSMDQLVSLEEMGSLGCQQSLEKGERLDSRVSKVILEMAEGKFDSIALTISHKIREHH